MSRSCFLYSCPRSTPRISFFHKVLPPLPLPLSHHQTASWAVKCFTDSHFSLREEDNYGCVSKIKSFSCVSLYLAHWRLFCLGFGVFFQDVLSPPGNLADHGSGALKADQGSCFIHCWKDVEFIYNHCVQQHLHPIPTSKHGTGAAQQAEPAKNQPQTSELAFHGNPAQGWGQGMLSPLCDRFWRAPEAGQCLEQEGEGAGVRGFQQLGGFFCTILTHLQNHSDVQHSGAFSAQTFFKVLR